MITVKQVYDAYPDFDLLGLSFVVNDGTTVAEIEAENCGDSLFVFLCRELCGEDIDHNEAVKRLLLANSLITRTIGAFIN